MPWEETENHIRSGHEDLDKYEKGSLRTIIIDADKGIKAIVGCPKGNYHDERCERGMHVQSYLFEKAKGWDMKKAKDWFHLIDKRS